MQNDITVGLASIADVASWMKLVELVGDNFPGLIFEYYRQTLIKNINRGSAVCAKDCDTVVGVLLFSYNQNTLSCMAVHPSYRKNGIATRMINIMLNKLPMGKDVTVTTFREDDEMGVIPRALYKKLGFVEGELCEEFSYPVQRFILHRT